MTVVSRRSRPAGRRPRRQDPVVKKAPSRLGDRGAVAVELAMVAPIMILMLMGAIDFGGAIFERMRLESAARAGAQYALRTTFSTEDVAGIEASVGQATGLDMEDVSVSAEISCECAGAAATCGQPCSGTAQPSTYVTVSLTKPYQTLFPYPGIPNPLTLVGQTMIRIQ